MEDLHRVSAGVSSTHVRYGDDRESVHLYDAPAMSEATIPIQDALYEACSELADPRKTVSFSGDATIHRIIDLHRGSLCIDQAQ